MSDFSNMIRKIFKEGDDIRDAGLTTPEDIVRFDDICYGDEPEWNVLDVYKPRASKDKKLPVIVSVHGGAWVYGDKERYQYYCMSLSQRGFAVINYTYRLAPEFQFPAPIEDLNSVTDWMIEHADEYGFDLENVFAVGDSAGGQMLAIYATMQSNPDYAALYDFKLAECRFKAVALNCGAYTIDMNADLTKGLMGDFLPEKGSEKEMKMLTLPPYITSAFPDTYLMSAEEDFLKQDVKTLDHLLFDLNVDHRVAIYVSKKNKLGHVFHLNMKLPEAKVCNDEECAFFKSRMN